ncbi:MAG: hypothetical protein M3O20_15455, partial [Acidobacteriota bacterium]|nr:hypothetical protein [Acidobacteriota bacterium]
MLAKLSAAHPHEDDLELYLRGKLEAEKVPFTEKHLMECNSCQLQLSNCLGQSLAVQIVSRPHAEAGATQK